MEGVVCCTELQIIYAVACEEFFYAPFRNNLLHIYYSRYSEVYARSVILKKYLCDERNKLETSICDTSAQCVIYIC